jgi:nucleotide-binding universal stress UspA family protein
VLELELELERVALDELVARRVRPQLDYPKSRGRDAQFARHLESRPSGWTPREENKVTPGSRRIVVAVDSSLNARLALEHATRRVGANGQLIVAHVVSSVPEPVAGFVGVVDERRILADQLVNQLVGAYAAGAEPVVLEGAVAERIAELAREREADEIVVGSRGLGRFSAAMGSVAHALLQQADHPVVVVPAAAADHPRDGRAHGRCTVVVGYDGSEPARSALSYAARRSCEGGRIVAVHAFQPVADWLGSPNYQQALDAYQEHGQQLLESLEAGHELDADLETSLLEGPPARAIVAAADARDADEIIVGSRGFGPLRGVLGSVSHAILHETDRVVVVIPADAVAGLGTP